MSRDVGFIRLVQSDAMAYDEGYVKPEELLDPVYVKGRGGTFLMLGIRLLEEALDFPKDSPILVITDGSCDVLQINSLCLLLAGSGRLPFSLKGPVFYFSKG